MAHEWQSRDYWLTGGSLSGTNKRSTSLLCVAARFYRGDSESAVCFSPDTKEIRWVTGQQLLQLCSVVNTDGRCPHYERKLIQPGDIDEPDELLGHPDNYAIDSS